MLADVRLPAGHNGITIDRMARQFAITSSIPLSALRPISCLAGAAARQNPHRRKTTRRFPRVRSSEAFGRRPLHRPINHVGPASETLHESGHPSLHHDKSRECLEAVQTARRPAQRTEFNVHDDISGVESYVQLSVKVTGNAVAGSELFLDGHLRCANRHGHRAAGVEMATGGWIDRVGYIAFEADAV